MKCRYVKILVRVLGTLSGLFGAASIALAAMMCANPGETGSEFSLLFVVPMALFGVYQLFICYLMWRKLSPLAIGNLFGIVGFYLVVVAQNVVLAPKTTSAWRPFLLIGLILLVFYSYRALRSRLFKALFSETHPGIK
jgi:hypothetical protein